MTGFIILVRITLPELRPGRTDSKVVSDSFQSRFRLGSDGLEAVSGGLRVVRGSFRVLPDVIRKAPSFRVVPAKNRYHYN